MRRSKAPEQHKTQYFEIIANCAIYHDGWMANTTPVQGPWNNKLAEKPATVNDYKWELYNLKEDFTQSKDLAKQYPEKLAAMQKLFMQEAE